MSSLATAAFPRAAVSPRRVRRPERNARRRVSETSVSRADGRASRLSPPRARPGVPFPWAPEGATQDAVLDELAARVVAAAFFGEGDGDARVFVGNAGAPGSGKSTRARPVRDRVNAAAGDDVAVVFPMDGFHYYMKDLRSNKDGLFPDEHEAVTRRGSPFTFDAERFVARVAAARSASGDDDVTRVPAFDHAVHDPTENAIEIKGSHKIVLVRATTGCCRTTRVSRDEAFDESWPWAAPWSAIARPLAARHRIAGRRA